MAKVIVVGILLATGVCEAKVMMKVERSGPVREHTALVFDEETIRLVRNSNFMCPAADEVKLGVFERKPTRQTDADRTYLEEIRVRLKRSIPAAKGSSPHNPRSYIDDFEVSGSETFAGTVNRVASDTCDFGGWTLKDGGVAKVYGLVIKVIQVKDTKFDARARKLLPVNQICRESDGKLTCEIPELGIAHFLKPAKK